MAPDAAASVLAGGGELGALMRSTDWAATPLGPVEHWPQSLRTCVRILLTCAQPMFVWWGPQLINLYNDAYCSILGGKHPWALGKPASEVWREIWGDVGPRATRAMRDNEGTFDEALLLIMERNGYREETYYTFSYSPVPGDLGEPGGIICANVSDTQRIYGERQQALLREVSMRTAGTRTVSDACTQALAAFPTNPRDLPFALLYLVDGGVAELAATAGIAVEHGSVRARIARGDDDAWGVPAVLDGAALHTRSLAVGGLPTGAWAEAPSEAIALPIRAADQSTAAVLVVGKNPFRLLDDNYRRFLELLAGQLGNAIASARSFEEEHRRIEALAELDRAKTTFFSNISHEFRTPLTLMLGPTEDALRSPARTLAGDALEAVHRNELRLLKLVNALLDFSRIEAGRIQTHYESTDLAQYTRELASAFRSAMERAGLWFEIDAPLSLPPLAVDRGMWEKIVLNLLSNALKFTFEGGVKVALRELDGEAVLAVSDTGIGIAAAELPRLFERFHRVEGARSRTHEGSGIGLALTAELVKLHDGSVDVTSEVGAGTTITVRIPVKRDVALHAPAREIGATGVSAFVEEAMRWLPEESGPVAGAAALPPFADDTLRMTAGARIVVADDNADMRQYLGRLLGAHWEVSLAPDGERALALARRIRPDLVLTDVMMPRLDGFGLLRALRDDPALASIPVVMLSARAGEESRIEGIEAGADDYLVKPFSARELIARVGNMLQLARLRRDVELERNRLAAFIEQTPVGVAIWNAPDLKLRMANETYRQMIDRPAVLGSAFADVFPELVGTPTETRLHRVLAEGSELETPENFVEFIDPGGTRERYFNNTLRPLRDTDGGVIAVVSVSVDITDQVRTRQIVETSRAEAVAANRAKDEFIAMLGHELRNPLAPILTALELMRLRAGDSLVRERAVIERQTQHLSALVDDLLDVSRIARGIVELKRERVLVADVLAKALETAAPLFEQQRHALETHVPPDLAVDGDPARLCQVFGNLLTNAAKYTDPGGRVTITAVQDGDEAVIAVGDNGRGIQADMLPKVFELFTQERQNLDRSRGGLGLGLAIAKNLVLLHHGRIDATSGGAGRGSTFTVHLPASASADVSAPRSSPAVSTTPPARPLLSVLVVDDNTDAASILADLLESRGYATRVAADAPEALEIARTFVPDVAVLDIGLPAMDGYELARRLRELPAWRGVRLLALTGYGASADRARSQAAGFDHHLVKPIDIATLERVFPTPGSTPD